MSEITIIKWKKRILEYEIKNKNNNLIYLEIVAFKVIILSLWNNFYVKMFKLVSKQKVKSKIIVFLIVLGNLNLKYVLSIKYL